MNERSCGIDERRCADREEHVAVEGRDGTLQNVRVDAFAKPDDARAYDPVAVRTLRRNLREGNRIVEPSRRRLAAVLPATDFPDRSMKANDVLRSSAFVQAVDVLRDERK